MAIFHQAFTFVDWNPSRVTSTSSPFDTTLVGFFTSCKDTGAWFQQCLWHTAKRVSSVQGGTVWPSSVPLPISPGFVPSEGVSRTGI